MFASPIVSILVQKGYLASEEARGPGGPPRVAAALLQYRREHPYLVPLKPSALDPSSEAECEICRDAGMVHPMGENGKVDYATLVTCQCQVDEVKKKKQQLILEQSGVPMPHREKCFNGFRQTELNNKAFFESLNFAGGEASYKILVLYGSAGNGKTHLAYSALREFAERGLLAKFVTFQELIGQAKAAFRDSGGQQVIDSYKTAEVLVLDDVGAEPMTDWTESVLEEIVNYRYGHELVTLLTTNEDPNDLPAPVISRLRDKDVCLIVHNKESDWRPTRKKRK